MQQANNSGTTSSRVLIHFVCMLASPCLLLTYSICDFVAPVSTVPTPVPPVQQPSALPANIKNDGSFLEQFKKMQQSQSSAGKILRVLGCRLYLIIWFSCLL